MTLPGSIASDQILKLRFPSSGKISQINFSVGQRVKKGQLLARLDQEERQTYLDRTLKQYEKVRADFEEKTKKELNEFDRIQVQAGLDISVKNVELAKLDLEAANLYAPSNGIVVEADPSAVGMNITPAAYTITLLDPDTLYFEVPVAEKDLSSIQIDQPVEIELTSYPDKTITGKVIRIGFAPQKNKYPVAVSIEGEKEHLRLGLTGKASFKNGQKKS